MEQCVLYARVSSKEQEREGFSIPAQIELLERYAYKNNYKIVEKFIDVETAKQSGRINFEKMLAFLKKNKTVRDVLVEKTDRLYRNLPDYVTVDGLNLNLHFVKEGVIINNESHSSEKFMHLIKVGMAKQYIDNLSEEVRKGISQKCNEGYYPSKAPIGYLNVTSPTKKKIIVPDINTSHYIKKCFERYASGLYSYKSLAKKMTDDGMRINGNPVRKHNIENILENPIEAKKLIGFLPEQPPVYPDMTVEEYLNFVYELKSCTLERGKHIDEVLSYVKLLDVRKRLIKNLSA